MLSPAQAAGRLGLTRQWVQRLCARGDIAAENIGTIARPRYVIREQECERFAALTRPQGRPRKDKTMDEDQAIKNGDADRLIVLLHRAKEFGDTEAVVRLRTALYNALGQSSILLAATERDHDPE